MDSEEHMLEQQLKALRPAVLDAALLDRLELAVTGGLQRDELAAAGVQAKLRDLQPTPPRADLLDRLEAVVEGVPFPVDEKVVLFPRGSTGEPSGGRSRRPWMAAAAAVALLGAVSALLVKPTTPETPVAGTRHTTTAPRPAPTIDRGAFVPAAFGSDVSDTRDLGVHWSDQTRPVRVMRVVFKDRVSFLNDKGEKVEVEVPRVEYVVVPEKID